jgi:hypothetical protein
VGKFIVTVAKADSEVQADYSLRILDQTGKAIDGASAMFVSPTSELAGDWERLRDLHDLARRRALHSEKGSRTFSPHWTKSLRDLLQTPSPNGE